MARSGQSRSRQASPEHLTPPWDAATWDAATRNSPGVRHAGTGRGQPHTTPERPPQHWPVLTTFLSDQTHGHITQGLVMDRNEGEGSFLSAQRGRKTKTYLRLYPCAWTAHATHHAHKEERDMGDPQLWNPQSHHSILARPRIHSACLCNRVSSSRAERSLLKGGWRE